jgi:chromosome segregation ATPase
VTQSQVNLEDLSRAFQHLEHQVQGLLSQKSFLDVNFKTVQDQIQTILQESNAINKELQHSLDAIREYQSKIAVAKQRLDVVIKDYDLHKEYFIAYVTLLYKIQNELYQDDGISEWKLLIKSTDISTTLSREEFVKIISDKIQFLLYDLQMQKQSYEAAIAQMNELYGNYQQKVDAFEQQLATIELQRKELLTLFQSIQLGQADILQSLTAVEGEQKLIEQQQRLLTTTRKDEREKLDAVQRIISKDEREFGSKFLTRPALPVKKILYYFQDESWKQQEKSEHLGLRISIPQ